MSKTLSVQFRGHGFWAFDIVSGVLLKHLIDAAVARDEASDSSSWLAKTVARWRVNAVVSDYGLFLDEGWTQRQCEIVVDLIAGACRVLSERDSIPADEIAAWPILDNQRIFTRGIDPVPTKPVVALGRAVIGLIDGTLAPAPAGTWWYYGTDQTPGTIGMGGPISAEGKSPDALPKASRDLVLKKIHIGFPNPQSAAQILALLDAYGTQSWHRERERVQLAILKQANSDIERVRRLVDLANQDYRDVLVGAEYPEEIQASLSTPPVEKLAIRKRDRDQYEAWLRSNEA